MKFPSRSLIFLGVILANLIEFIHLVLTLLEPPSCIEIEDCTDYALFTKPQLSLNIYSSAYSYPVGLDVIHNEEDFNYLVPRQMKLVLPIHEETRQNGSLFLHVILKSSRSVKYPGTYYEIIQEPFSVYIKIRLTHYTVPKITPFYLLSDGKKFSNNEELSIELVTHFIRHVNLRIVTNDVKLSAQNLPPDLKEILHVPEDGKLQPIFYHHLSKTWYSDLVKISPQDEAITVTVDYSPISISELRLIMALEKKWGRKLFRFTEKDVAELTEIFTDTNLYLLGGMVFIVVMHSVFEFLTFRYDVDYWSDRKSLRGLGAGTIFWNAFSLTIIFLYQLDEQCLTMYLIFSGTQLIRELWGSRQSLRVKLVTGQGWLPRIKFQNNESTPDEKGVRKFKTEITRYLSRLLCPLVIGGVAYSLVFQPHKSWYSWTIHSLVHGVYAFDFLFMFPQLLENYKLKSVPYIPWRAFSYKVCYTFIDDVFAFVIPMPTAYRISCFRNDIVFLIEIYQRWIYPVDKSDKKDTVAKDQISPPNELQDKKEN